ncbi:MAG: SH3 domain-containing protein [Lachnospiraceae bacterium]|nr:SH3 domain-containing protein [Lachnospiraceae bacterium]
MKKRLATKAGSILLAAALGVSGAVGTGTFAFAEEETEAAATEMETETAAEEAEAVEPTEVEVTLGETTLTIMNETGIALSEVSAGELTGETDESDQTEADADNAEATAEEQAGLTLVFTQEDGTEHAFEVSEESELTALTDLTLTEKLGFFFLYGTDANGDAKYFYETADEITLEESVTMYATGSVTIREEADGSSEALGYVDRGSEVEVLGGTSTWFQIKQGETTGYVAARYLTADEAEAQAAVDAEASAQEAAAQDAAAQAAAAAAAAASSAADSSSGTTETPATDDACLTGGVLN